MFSNRKSLALAVVASGVIALGAAFGFQHIGGLDPCVLCLYQRWPWVAVIALGALAFTLRGQRAVAGTLLVLAGLAMLVGAGIAGFHVGVEQHWWAGTAECGSTLSKAATIEGLKRQLMATPITRCDEVAWSLGGISMAGWNMVLSLASAMVVAWSLVAQRRSS